MYPFTFERKTLAMCVNVVGLVSYFLLLIVGSTAITCQ